MFRIATFNLQNLDTEPHDRLAARFAILVPMLRRTRADILCLQEIHAQENAEGRRELRVLRDLLTAAGMGDYRVVSTNTEDGRLYSLRNVVIASRFPIVQHEQYRNDLIETLAYRRVTSDPPDLEADPVRWERPLLYAQIEITRGKILHVVNMHLKSRIPTRIPGQTYNRGILQVWQTVSGWAEGYFLSSIKRVGQALEARYLVDRIFDAHPDPHLVVAGDFNAEPDEVPVRTLIGNVEATHNPELRPRALFPAENTIPEPARYTLLHQGHRRLIDHLLMSQAMVSCYRHSEIHNETLPDETISGATQDLFPDSDHAPFISEFTWDEDGYETQ